MAENERTTGDEPLSEDIKMIIGGVATIVLLVVPVLLVRRIVKVIEESDSFKNLEKGIGDRLS